MRRMRESGDGRTPRPGNGTPAIYATASGQPIHADKRIAVPVNFFGPRYIEFDVFEDPKTPSLVGVNTLAALGATVGFGKATIKVRGVKKRVEKDKKHQVLLDLVHEETDDIIGPRGRTNFTEFCSALVARQNDVLSYAQLEKLHRQFNHMPKEAMARILRLAGKRFEKTDLDGVYEKCEPAAAEKVWKQNIPKVSGAVPGEFNEEVHADIATIERTPVYVLKEVLAKLGFAKVLAKKSDAWKALLEYIERYNPPSRHLSDNDFSGKYANLAERFDIEMRNLAAKSQWGNEAERLIQCLRRGVRKLRLEFPDAPLEALLSQILIAYNNTPHAAGVSPNEAAIGAKYRPLENPPVQTNAEPFRPPLPETVEERMKILRAARKWCLEERAKTQVERGLKTNVVRPCGAFQPNQEVLFRHHSSTDPEAEKQVKVGWVMGGDKSTLIIRRAGRLYQVYARHVEPYPENGACASAKRASLEVYAAEEGPAKETQSLATTEKDPGREKMEAHKNENDEQNEIEKHLDECHAAFLLAGEDPEQEGGDSSILGPEEEAKMLQIKKGHEIFFSNAKEAELAEWIKHGVVGIPENEPRPLPGEIVDSRWVLTWKEGAQGFDPRKYLDRSDLTPAEKEELVASVPKNHRPKARLVVRGFQERFTANAASPTIRSSSVRTALSLFSTLGWKAQSLDIPTAFLRGKPIKREVYIRCPPELQQKGFPEVSRIVKGLYGLNDGPLLFYHSLRDFLVNELGCKCLIHDKSVFVKHDQHGRLLAIFAAHVDDILFGFEESFQPQIDKLIKKFEVKTVESGRFKYLGDIVEQTGQTFALSQKSYAENISPIRYENRVSTERQITASEKLTCQQRLGALNWLSVRSRPDLLWNTSRGITMVHDGHVKVLPAVNKLVRQAKARSDSKVRIHHLADNVADLMILSIFDASFDYEGILHFIINARDVISPDGSYKSGIILELQANLIAHASRKLKRVTISSETSELLAGVDAIDASIILHNIIQEIVGRKYTLRPPLVLTDSRNLIWNVYSSYPKIKEQRFLRYTQVIRQQLDMKSITDILHIPGKLNPADPLTKNASNANLLKLLQGEKITITIDKLVTEN